MAAQLTIGGTTVTFIEDTLDITYNLDERQRLQCDLIDYTGSLHFVKGEQVVLTDPVLGVMFNGFLNTDQEFPVYPAGIIRHTIDCIDLHYLADKRTYTRSYDAPQPAGKLAVDQLHDVLLTEGITQNFAQHTDSTVDDFSQGIFSSTIAASNVDDGNLELSPAGSDVTITESATADFSSGTLSNVTATSNTLTPTTQNALKFSATLPTSTNNSSFIRAKIWSGSMALATNDTLFFDVWVSDSSPEKVGGIQLLFSDLTRSTSIYDQNALSINSDTDLSGYAVNAWYTRQFSLTPFNGKTVIAVLAVSGGDSVGTYTWYIKNCYLGSQTGNKFFAPTSTAPQLNPPTIYQISGYVASTFTTSVVTTYDPANTYRISPSHSIDAVKLLKGSYITWVASSSVFVYASYNGGSSWIPCSINSPLPGMPAGSNVAGLSMLIKEIFGASDDGNDPTGIPVLELLAVSLTSAPNATKSDVVTSFLTQANWNTGTHSSTQADSSGNLELASYLRDWSSGGTTGQTSYFPTGTTQSVSGGVYTMSLPANTMTTPGTNGFGTSSLDFLGTMRDFTLEADIKTSSSTTEACITYRQIHWNASVNNTFGYMVGMYPSSTNELELGYGSNADTDSYTQIASAGISASTNTLYHIKIVVNGSRHQVYFNNATTPTIDVTDTTYTQSGGIGLRGFNGDGSNAHTASWDNVALAQITSGTWTSASTSVSSLTTCGGSVITWTESGTSNPSDAFAFVQSSIDGGSTYQQCTNNAIIPGLSNGVSLASKSVKLQILLGTQTNTAPMVSGLVWRVLGVYPGSSGTRSTIPLGNDTMVRSNSTGSWGTSFDSQTYIKVGTGTTNLTSNEGLIANTTGDVHMVLGSRVWDDEDGTVRFQLSASTITGGIELRYVDSNNFYRLSASTTTLSIVQKRTSTTILASTSISLSTGVSYWMRFRVVGNGPVSFYGRVWADGTKEDQTTWNITTSA